MKRDREYPPLWRRRDTILDADCVNESTTYASLLEQFSYKPDPKRWSTICKNSFVVGQEFSLTCYILAQCRLAKYDEQRQLPRNDWKHFMWSLGTMLVSLLIVTTMRNHQVSRQGLSRWTIDSICLVARLTLLATTLKITTLLHFSTDAIIHTVAVAGMAIHVLGCDYSFANGIDMRMTESTSLSSSGTYRPTTLSNAAFFSTTVLASQLQSNWTVFVFVSASVAVFSLHPNIRHDVHTQLPQLAPYCKLTKQGYEKYAQATD